MAFYGKITILYSNRRMKMASEAVKRILEAEAESGRKTAEARQRSEDMINDAVGSSAHTVQKKLSEAAAEAEKEKAEYFARLTSYTENAEHECRLKIEELSAIADRNMKRAADAIIAKYF